MRSASAAACLCRAAIVAMLPCRSLRARDPRHYHFHFDIFFIIDFHFLDAIIAAIDAIRRHAIFADASPSPIFITP
jgi:hypothetical protein